MTFGGSMWNRRAWAGTCRAVLTAFACAAVLAAAASAGTVVYDGFGDADRDNDGTTDGAAVSDAGDVGIRWYSIDQTSSSLPKPNLTVVDDSAGIGAGNALHLESRGSNGEMIGVFGQTISLGSQVGDKIIFSFDVRIDDSVHARSDAASFRFGPFQDNGELGTGGWGTSDGKFDNANNPGPGDDLGYQLRLPTAAAPNADAARIQDEYAASGTIFGRSTDFIAKPDDALGAGVFSGIGDTLAHSVKFIIERTGPGDNDLVFTLQVDSAANSFGGSDGTDTIVSATSFDYFAFEDRDADFDYLIDNFRVAVVVPEPATLVLVIVGGLGLLAAGRRCVS